MNTETTFMREHCRFKFFTKGDGLSVTIVENDAGDFCVREKILLEGGPAQWLLRLTAKSLDEAVGYCRSHYLERDSK
jgi:hypothetical protein